MKTVDPSHLCIFSCLNAPNWARWEVCWCQGQVKFHAHKLLCPPLPPGLISGIWVLDHYEPSVRISLVLNVTCSSTPHPQTPNCTLWLFDVTHPRSVSAPCCALMYAKQPVEFIITNAAQPLNKWQEAPWHNKITRERARNKTQMRFHSHKLPLYYTWSIFTIGNSK